MRASKVSSLAALALLPLLVLAGCAGGAEVVPSATTVASPTPTPTPTPEPEPVFIPAPLSGVTYLEGTNNGLAAPALSAKIDNTFAGMPSYGINNADIVFVERVEGGMTRLLGVWHSVVPEAVGPVRSVRPVDPDIAAPFGGIMIYSGGQAPFKSAMVKTGLYNADEDTESENDTYYREKSRSAPWNLYFSTRKLQAMHLDRAAPEAFFGYASGTELPTAVAEGVEALDVKIKYPGSTSAWEVGTAEFGHRAGTALIAGTAEQPAWLRSLDGKEVFDGKTEERVRAKNVVILDTKLDLSFIDPRYGAIPKAILVSEGTGTVFTDGYYLAIKWSKASQSAPIVLTTLTGEPVLLAPGNTWVELRDLPRATVTITDKNPPTPTATPSPTP